MAVAVTMIPVPVPVPVLVPVPFAVVGSALRTVPAPASRSVTDVALVPVTLPVPVPVSLAAGLHLARPELVFTVVGGATFVGGSGPLRGSRPRSTDAGPHPVPALRVEAEAEAMSPARGGVEAGTRTWNGVGTGSGSGTTAALISPVVTGRALVEAVAAPVAAVSVRVAALVAVPAALRRAGVPASAGVRSLTVRRPVAPQAAQPSRVPRFLAEPLPLSPPGVVRLPKVAITATAAAADVPRTSLTVPGDTTRAVGWTVSGTWTTVRLGRERGRGWRGHRPIIARTRGPSVHRARIDASVEALLHTRELGAPG